MFELQVKSITDVPFCCDGCGPIFINDSIVLVHNKTSVSVWMPNGKPFDSNARLVGHSNEVTAMCLSLSDKKFLCSCSSDKVILWNIETACHKKYYNGEDILGTTVALNCGEIEHCDLSWNKSWLALCKNKEIWIIMLTISELDVLESINHHSVLETGVSSGNMCSFSPLYTDLLVSIEGSNYFKVWNVRTHSMLHQCNFGTSALIYCEFSMPSGQLMLGSNGGSLHVYSIEERHPTQCSLTVQVGKLFFKDLNTTNEASNAAEPQSIAELNCQVYSARMFMDDPPKTFTNEETLPEFAWDTDDVSRIRSPTPIIVACCNFGIAMFNYKSWDCLAYLPFKDLVMEGFYNAWGVGVAVLGGDKLSSIHCALRWMTKVCVLTLATSTLPSPLQESVVLPTAAISINSPLYYHPINPEPVTQSPYDTTLGKLKKKQKSSGYSIAPRMTMFQPAINRGSPQTRLTSVPTQSCSKLCINNNSLLTRVLSHRERMRKCGILDVMLKKMDVWHSQTSVHLAASGNGKYLACSNSLPHSEICVLDFTNLDVTKNIFLNSPDGGINSLHFSLDSTWLVSSHHNNGVKVWDWKRKKWKLSIDGSCRYDKVHGKLTQEAELPNGMIPQSRFYYMDQFILVAIGGNLELYSHTLNASGVDSLEKPRCCRVCKVPMSTQYITSFSAANQFYSNVALVGCSNRQVKVYDLNAEQTVLEMRDVHTRPPHQVLQVEGSWCMSHSPMMYDLCLTAAICDGAKLWDLRTSRVVQKLNRHLNRAYSSGCDLSPCGRYIALSSDDNSVYMYDARKSENFVSKAVLGDVGMDVVFNPCQPRLAAAALNGQVTIFTDRTSS